MKKILLIFYMASGIPAWSAEPEIGTIVAAESLPPKEADIVITYDYDTKGKLVLSLQNISMNAAARGVNGSAVVNGGKILIQPKERYDSRGPVESLRWYTIQYVLQNVQPGRYTIVHDDSAAEGTDRVARVELDLTIPAKGTKTVIFKVPHPSEDPFAEPHETKTEQSGGANPAKPGGSP